MPLVERGRQPTPYMILARQAISVSNSVVGWVASWEHES
jgi:hypothetical protein